MAKKKNKLGNRKWLWIIPFIILISIVLYFGIPQTVFYGADEINCNWDSTSGNPSWSCSPTTHVIYGVSEGSKIEFNEWKGVSRWEKKQKAVCNTAVLAGVIDNCNVLDDTNWRNDKELFKTIQKKLNPGFMVITGKVNIQENERRGINMDKVDITTPLKAWGTCIISGRHGDVTCEVKKLNDPNEKVGNIWYNTDYKIYWKKDGYTLEEGEKEFGFECLKNDECPKDEKIGEKFCSTDITLSQKYKIYECQNYKCVSDTITKEVKKCDTFCEDGICVEEKSFFEKYWVLIVLGIIVLGFLIWIIKNIISKVKKY